MNGNELFFWVLIGMDSWIGSTSVNDFCLQLCLLSLSLTHDDRRLKEVIFVDENASDLLAISVNGFCFEHFVKFPSSKKALHNYWLQQTNEMIFKTFHFHAWTNNRLTVSINTNLSDVILIHFIIIIVPSPFTITTASWSYFMNNKQNLCNRWKYQCDTDERNAGSFSRSMHQTERERERVMNNGWANVRAMQDDRAVWIRIAYDFRFIRLCGICHRSTRTTAALRKRTIRSMMHMSNIFLFTFLAEFFYFLLSFFLELASSRLSSHRSLDRYNPVCALR